MDVRESKIGNTSFPILFATDVGYAPHLGTAIWSLLQNNKSLNIRIIVFTTSLPQKDRNKLKEICDRFDVQLEFTELEDNWFDGLILNHHFKKSNYYRLFAAELIGDDKCLYLDADIVVNGTISEIINTDLGDSYLAAVLDPSFKSHSELGMSVDSRYFNSGVMLLNLKKWRNTKLKDRVILFVKKKPGAIRFVDQCGLNGVIDGEWVDLDAKYNFQSSMLSGSYNSNCATDEIPHIVHYTGSSKPWHVNNKHHYKNLYWHYRNQTPYKIFLPYYFSLLKFVRYVTPQSVKTLYRNIVGKKLI